MRLPVVAAAIATAILPLASAAEIKVTAERSPGESAVGRFQFKTVPPPAKVDAATKATFTLVDGSRDQNGGDLSSLHDGRLPTNEDQPAANFFFRQGTDGGRLRIDLGTNTTIRQINTYSWHGSTRAPQVYQLYASDGAASGFDSAPKRGNNPESCGWTLIAKVDTRPKDDTEGGQHGASVSNPTGNLGAYRYLLFDISRTESRDPFGNTFFS